jgi:hypothetical protein
LVFFDFHDGALTWDLWIFVIATRRWIHGCYKHKVWWISNCATGTRDMDVFVFDRLTEDFKYFSGKFWEFIKKENTFV